MKIPYLRKKEKKSTIKNIGFYTEYLSRNMNLLDYTGIIVYICTKQVIREGIENW